MSIRGTEHNMANVYQKQGTVYLSPNRDQNANEWNKRKRKPPGEKNRIEEKLSNVQRKYDKKKKGK